MIPVVVFAFRRPDLLEQTLDALAAQGVPLLIAFSDGPRDAAEAGPVEAVRRVLRSVRWCPVELVERPVNLGLGRSVLDGVGSVLARHQAAIFLEDDLVCQPGAYRYLSAALRRYAHDQRVLSVTGWTHPRITPGGLGGRPYFDGKGECWIWGTWRRAWRGMERPAMDIMRACAERGIDIERYGTDMPKMAAEAAGRNLWAIGWWYQHLLTGGLCLRPPHSLGEHIGWDSRATTTLPEMIVWRNPPLPPCPRIPDSPGPSPGASPDASPDAWPEPVEHPDCARLWRIAIGDPA